MEQKLKRALKLHSSELKRHTNKSLAKNNNVNAHPEQKHLLNQWENNLYKETNKGKSQKRVKNKLALMKRALNRRVQKQTNNVNLMSNTQRVTSQQGEWNRGYILGEKTKNIPQPAKRWIKLLDGEWKRNYSLDKTQKSRSKFDNSKWPSP